MIRMWNWWIVHSVQQNCLIVYSLEQNKHARLPSHSPALTLPLHVYKCVGWEWNLISLSLFISLESLISFIHRGFTCEGVCVRMCVRVCVHVWPMHTSNLTNSYLRHDFRPTQLIIYVPLQVHRFQKIYLLIVQYKYLKSCSKHFILQNLILRTRLCGTGFIIQTNCVLDFHFTEICQAEMICIGGVPVLKRHFGGAGPWIFYMIHKGGRIHTCAMTYSHTFNIYVWQYAFVIYVLCYVLSYMFRSRKIVRICFVLCLIIYVLCYVSSYMSCAMSHNIRLVLSLITYVLCQVSSYMSCAKSHHICLVPSLIIYVLC